MKRKIATLGGAALAVTGAVGLLAMGGCSKKGEETTSVATVKPAASAPQTPPARKAGLWEQKISTANINQSMKMCLDDAVE